MRMLKPPVRQPKAAQTLMMQVLVFNCDGEFDFKSVGRIFMGLVKCGAWGCFDEFNRLEENVLSAVSQQIQLIQVQCCRRIVDTCMTYQMLHCS